MPRAAPSAGARAEPWCVIPVKPFALGKSRLGLPDRERRHANRCFLDHVLATARIVIPSARIIVVSRDDDALAMATAVGAHALREPSASDLNAALSLGARFAADRGAQAVLSVFADLPHLAASDLLAMIDGFDGANVVMAPDEGGTGTNAMLMAPGRIGYSHGSGSLARHIDGAHDAGVPFALVRRPGLMRDVDSLSDYAVIAAAIAG